MTTPDPLLDIIAAVAYEELFNDDPVYVSRNIARAVLATVAESGRLTPEPTAVHYEWGVETVVHKDGVEVDRYVQGDEGLEPWDRAEALEYAGGDESALRWRLYWEETSDWMRDGEQHPSRLGPRS